MEVIVAEAPGGVPDVYVCPYCSRTYLTCEVENGELKLDIIDQGGQKVIKYTVEPPKNCRRCNSPMDIELSRKFADEMAEKAATPLKAGGRRTVKV